MSVKTINDGQKREKKKTPQETESKDELPRVSPSEQEGLKHILVSVDAVPVLIRYARKQHCFKGCFSWLNFSREEVAANVPILRESVEAYVCRLWCMPFSISDG